MSAVALRSAFACAMAAFRSAGVYDGSGRPRWAEGPAAAALVLGVLLEMPAWAGALMARGPIARAARPTRPMDLALVPRGVCFTHVPFAHSDAGISGLRLGGRA